MDRFLYIYAYYRETETKKLSLFNFDDDDDDDDDDDIFQNLSLSKPIGRAAVSKKNPVVKPVDSKQNTTVKHVEIKQNTVEIKQNTVEIKQDTVIKHVEKQLDTAVKSDNSNEAPYSDVCLASEPKTGDVVQDIVDGHLKKEEENLEICDEETERKR